MNAYDKAAVEQTVRDCLMARPYSTVREIAGRIDESPSRVYTATAIAAISASKSP